MISTALLCLAITLAVSPSVRPQLSEKEKQEKEAERKQQLERKTYALVDEIAGGALSLKLPENRAYMLAAAADLLWEHNEPRARNLFWDASNTLMLMMEPARNIAIANAAQNKERDQAFYVSVFALKQDFIRRVARRDPQLALDMLRSSRLVSQPATESLRAFPFGDERDLEQQIAAEAAARDPRRAFALARESLAQGLSFHLLELLYKLNDKDTELGTKFAGNIIEKLRARNMANDLHAGRLAISLLTYSRVPADVPERVSTGAGWKPLKLEEEQRRELVEMITNAALTGSADGNLLFGVDEVMPEIQQFTPERVSPLGRKLAAFNQTLNKEQRISGEYNSLFRNGTPEQIIHLASSASEQHREWMQQQAVVMAVMRGRSDSLRQFVNNEIGDEARRKSLLDMLDTEQIDLASSKGDSEGLKKLLPQIRRKEERARALTVMAVALEKNGAHEEALKLLNDAQSLIKTDLNSETKTNALLALVAAYALVEPAKAFAIVEQTIDRANEDVARLLLLDKIAKSGAVKKGEIRLQQLGIMPIDFAVFKYGKAVAALANVDFDRTRAAADRFERNELRLLVRLLLAQALVQKEDVRSQNSENTDRTKALTGQRTPNSSDHCFLLSGAKSGSQKSENTEFGVR